MSRFFSVYTFFSVLLFFSFNSYAKTSPKSIVENKDVSACAEKQAGNDSECLSSVSKRTEKKLNAVYQEKFKEIENYDFSQWWMGEKKQRDDMQKAFNRSQEAWLKYRQDYCKAASAGAEGTDSYSAIVLSCEINMATRRIEEIRMIHPDLSDG